MAHVLLQSTTLSTLLSEELLLPPNCRHVELLMPAVGVLALRYDVVVTAEDLPKIARALLRFHESVSSIPKPTVNPRDTLNIIQKGG